MPDFASVAQYGIAAMCVVGLFWFLHFITKKMLDAYNANTQVLNEVSLVMRSSLERDQAFQQEMLQLSRETNIKVKDIHRKVV